MYVNALMGAGHTIPCCQSLGKVWDTAKLQFPVQAAGVWEASAHTRGTGGAFWGFRVQTTWGGLEASR